MMHKTWRTTGGLFTLALTCCLAVAAAMPGSAWGNGSGGDLAALPAMAEQGEFNQLLERLEADYAGLGQPPVDSLIADLRRHRDLEVERAAERRESFEQAMAEAEMKLGEDNIEDALVAAIEAHGLAEKQDDFLKRERIGELVSKAREAAEAASERGDWVRTLGLYRLLDLLYDDRTTFREPLKQAQKHVRVLQVYAPERLRELQEAQLERRNEAGGDGETLEFDGEEVADLPDIEAEPWEQRLDGVDAGMLRATLHQSARRHVSSQGYAPLMIGAVDALLVMVNTDDLAETFPVFADQAKRDRMRMDLERLGASLREPGKSMNPLEVNTTIDRIMVINDRSLELPESVLVYEMTEGATQTLDEFSSVIWPAETETFSRSLQGRFFGVGIQISRRDGRLVVVSPLANTPAQRAGVKAGDVIAQVDGRDTATWGLERAVREITGPENTEVTLGLERGGEQDLVDVKLRRAEIVIESIRGWQHTDDGGWDYLIDRESRIGYVRMSQFIPQTADDLDTAVAEMEADGKLNGLILDLRFNPGGLLSSAIDVADRFVGEGTLVSTVDANGRQTFQGRAKRHVTLRDELPVVVLINQGSASASEIVAGALQDYERATIVGTRSFGKGSVQDPFPLERGKAVLKLTTQYYQLPLGRIIDRVPDAETWGIDPDLMVKMTDEQVSKSLEFRQQVDVLRDNAQPAEDEEGPVAAADILTRGMDPQLESALLLLKTRQVARDIAVAQAQGPAAVESR